MKKKLIGSAVLAGALFMAAASSATAMTAKERLGHMLYSDKYLSKNHNQSCMSCHHPAAGWADPVDAAMPDYYAVSFGSDRSLNGCRNAPPSGYAAFSPIFSWDADTGYFGGQFWDGREDTVADQAKKPFTNPVEMANETDADVIAAIVDGSNPRSEAYRSLFKQAYGDNLKTLNYTDPAVVSDLFNKVADAIGSFEQTTRFTRFTSKYDYYLAGMATLSDQEVRGLELFKANCSACHPSDAQYNTADDTITPPLFTDFTYDNLGVPVNHNWMLERADCNINPDLGLGGELGLPDEDGKFKVSSLRNIAKTPPYAHNGYFASLEEIVHFYNTRDVVGAGWPDPEVSANLNVTELGNLSLSVTDEADLVAFLQTLTDGFGDTTPANFVLPAITPLPPLPLP
ncbi:MAG: cytochrome-c peroxidase [Proteobacteria bacterium]|nr:cytochrome-c peroxidase [Pseudomonadota bacterium]MBU4296221.1 cytochrome-c peroxidase [Pseudomonadota bacterium]MCG2746421.1 c-type cytochrome [Desulfobulbaceae bacterium]